jgi:hypothetical protein
MFTTIAWVHHVHMLCTSVITMQCEPLKDCQSMRWKFRVTCSRVPVKASNRSRFPDSQAVNSISRVTRGVHSLRAKSVAVLGLWDPQALIGTLASQYNFMRQQPTPIAG